MGVLCLMLFDGAMFCFVSAKFKTPSCLHRKPTFFSYQGLRGAMVQVHGVNCFTARWNWQGIAATAETRAPHDVAGQRLKIRFNIVDRRFGVLAGPVKEGEVDPNRVQRGPYTVYLTLQV